MFVNTVIVAGDGARTNIHTATNLAIADVAEVVDFGASSNLGFFYLNEVTDVYLFRQDSSRT